MEGWYAQQFDFGTRMASAVGTLSIAAIVATIQRAQWKTNQEKLRLDLYAKRFDIYMRTLDFHNALLEWKDEPEQIALIAPFYRAFRESRFLFPESAGVYRFMEEFSQHAFHITYFREVRDASWAASPNQRTDLALERTTHVNWILNSVSELEEQMAPFLNFHAL